MNRAERRRAARDMTHATQSIMRARGGYEREYERGAKDAERHAIKMIFAGMCLAMKEEFRFGAQRIYRMLTATQKYLQPGAYFTTAELIDEVLEKTGIRLDFDDPFDMVERIEKGERR